MACSIWIVRTLCVILGVVVVIGKFGVELVIKKLSISVSRWEKERDMVRPGRYQILTFLTKAKCF